MKKTDILLIADEPLPLSAGLQKAGFSVSCSCPKDVSGINFREFCLVVMFTERDYPGEYFDACVVIFRQSNIPIVVIGNLKNCTIFLELGADRFIDSYSKIKTVIALVRSVRQRLGLSWRERDEMDLEIKTDRFVFSEEKHEVLVENELVHFAPREFKLLAYLLNNKGRLVFYQDIIDQVWDEDWLPESIALNVALYRVRRKLGSTVQIITITKTGLLLTIPECR